MGKNVVVIGAQWGDEGKGKVVDLLTENAHDLFPEVPIVFAGINDYHPAMTASRPKSTGVMQQLDVAGTLEMALAMHPGARNALVIHDYSASGIAVRHEAEHAPDGVLGHAVGQQRLEQQRDGLGRLDDGGGRDLALAPREVVVERPRRQPGRLTECLEAHAVIPVPRQQLGGLVRDARPGARARHRPPGISAPP